MKTQPLRCFISEKQKRDLKTLCRPSWELMFECLKFLVFFKLNLFKTPFLTKYHDSSPLYVVHHGSVSNLVYYASERSKRALCTYTIISWRHCCGTAKYKYSSLDKIFGIFPDGVLGITFNVLQFSNNKYCFPTESICTMMYTYMIVFSQNHRMFGVGRDLCGSSSPTLLPKQRHLQQAAQDLVQVGLKYLQRRRLIIKHY